MHWAFKGQVRLDLFCLNQASNVIFPVYHQLKLCFFGNSRFSFKLMNWKNISNDNQETGMEKWCTN